MHLPQNIKYLAGKAGIKNFELAEQLDVSSTQVGYYMSGKSNPKIETLIKLGQLFDIAIDDLILVDLSKGEGRKFGEGAADDGETVDAQTRELNKLLRQRVAQVEAALKRENPELARELGIE